MTAPEIQIKTETTYDSSYNMIRVQNSDASLDSDEDNCTYTYDSLNRLTGINAVGNEYTFTYDKWGNRVETKLGGSVLCNDTYTDIGDRLQKSVLRYNYGHERMNEL